MLDFAHALVRTEEIYVPHCGWLRFPEGDNVARFLREGWCDYRELAFLWRLLRPGDDFLDGGAHAGLYSLVALSASGPGGRVIAVDPSPETAQIYEQNFADFIPGQRVMHTRAALAPAPGHSRFLLSRPGRSAFDHLAAAGEETEGAIDVELATIDALLEQHGIEEVACAKLDLEGAEGAALAGAAQSMSRVHCWLVEFTELNLRRFGSSSQDLVQAIENAGLGLYRWNEEGQLSQVEEHGPIWYENLIATSEPEWVRRRLESSSQDHRRIAGEILARGRASDELQSGALHMALDQSREGARFAREQWHAANRRLADSDFRVQRVQEDLDEAYRRLGEASWLTDDYSKRFAAALERAQKSELAASAALQRAARAETELAEERGHAADLQSHAADLQSDVEKLKIALDEARGNGQAPRKGFLGLLGGKAAKPRR